MASFLYKNSEENGVEIRVWDLCSHSDTQSRLRLTEKAGWYEGHYLPDGEIECRKPYVNKDNEAEIEIRRRYKTFAKFLNWCFKQNIRLNTTLDLTNCDLNGIKFPKKIGWNLYLNGCDLKGIRVPDEIGRNLYLCNAKNIDKDALKNVKISGILDLSKCDLKGIKLPKEIGTSLWLNGVKNIDKDALKNVKIGFNLYLAKCDLKGIKLPKEIVGNLCLDNAINIDEEALKKVKIGGKIYR
jgi:hypothetical protein